MKHSKKIFALLLAVSMLVVMLPSYLGGLAPTVEAADVGTIENGSFETVYDYTRSDGSVVKEPSGWNVGQAWAATASTSSPRSGSYCMRFSYSSTVANVVGLEQVVAINTNGSYKLSFYVKGGTKNSNCDYIPCYTYEVKLGTSATSFTETVLSGTPSSGSGWTSNSHSFDAGSYKFARIRFIATGTGSNDSYLDVVSMSTTSAGDTGTHAVPALQSFGVDENRPASSSDNIVVQPGFESATNAQWNTSEFIKTNLSVVSTDSFSGSNSLYYNNTTSTESWHEFSVQVPSGGTYVLSAWVKTPYLSSTNTAKASIGIIDPNTNQFLYITDSKYQYTQSSPTAQIRSTAPDNEWHLRSVSFYVGTSANIRIGVYGVKSQMYIDDISVHAIGSGVTYTGNQTGTLSATTTTSNIYCESANNLIDDCNMSSNISRDFWQGRASGWNNGFMSFEESDEDHGYALKFAGTSPASYKAYNYIKWIYVEPNTTYTVSFDYRVTAKGSGSLKFIDNNIEKPVAFKTLSFSSTTSDWVTTAFTFSSGNYNRIGIVFTDGTASALFDDFRFFKSSNGISTEPAEEVFPTLKHTHTGKSRMETEGDLLGLAFKFTLKSTGATRNSQFVGDYTNAVVQAFEDGKDYTLLRTGAIMTNQETVGRNPDIFNLQNLDGTGNTVIDINAKYLFNDPATENNGTTLTFAVRICNIPADNVNTIIYARPYYVFDYKGNEIVVYGDVVFDSYEPMKDINDGWLEWD